MSLQLLLRQQLPSTKSNDAAAAAAAAAADEASDVEEVDNDKHRTPPPSSTKRIAAAAAATTTTNHKRSRSSSSSAPAAAVSTPHIGFHIKPHTLKLKDGANKRMQAHILHAPTVGYDGKPNRRTLTDPSLKSLRIEEQQYARIDRFYSLAPRAFWAGLTLQEFVLSVAQGACFFTKEAQEAFMRDMGNGLPAQPNAVDLRGLRMARTLFNGVLKTMEERFAVRKSDSSMSWMSWPNPIPLWRRCAGRSFSASTPSSWR